MREALILVAHADDETLGAGGTIPLLVRSGWRVTVVVLSDAIRFTGVVPSEHVIEDPDHRRDVERACEVLGVHQLHLVGVPDQKFDTVPMAELAQTVLSFGIDPELTITHSDHDLNMDHRLTCEVAKIVCRPRSKPISILSCEIPNTAFWNGQPFPANFYVNVGDTLATKIAAFRQYDSEIRTFPDPWSEKGLRRLAQYRGMQCGCPYAEAFTVIRGHAGQLPGS